MTNHSSGAWAHPPRKHRTTWNYQASSLARNIAQFLLLFLASLFVISLLIRATIGIY